MTEAVFDTQSTDVMEASDPLVAVKRATGVEVAVFGRGPIQFAPTCVRQCLVNAESENAQGACELVSDLAQGVEPEGSASPHICRRGHIVSTFSHAPGEPILLLLRPSPDEPSGVSRADHYAQQILATGEVWHHLDRLNQENEGLAKELISTYEQLNVIFDITKHMGEVQDVRHIRRSMLRLLANTLVSDWACCLAPESEVQWWCADPTRDRDATLSWVRHAMAGDLREVYQSHQIVVRNRSQGRDELPFSLMIGPVGDAEEPESAVVLARGPGHHDFHSGEMRMLDTILEHGRQVIANLRLMARLKTLSMEAVLSLVSAIDKKDSYTSGHSERVGVLSRLTGQEMGLKGEDLQDLEWAGILHDVGKIGIKDGILTKPAGLTDDEFDVIRQHPRMSYEVIAPLHSFGAVCEAVLHHHETPDGKGYPDGLKGDDIPMLARIIHVTDTFDALTSNRSYRRGFPVEKAMNIMRKELGTKIDAACFAAFETALNTFRSQEPDRFRQMFHHFEELMA